MSDTHELLSLTADIVSAHVSNNSVAANDVAGLISAVHAALEGLGQTVEEPTEEQKPAVSIRASVKPDYIVCLEDGKKLKMLKRYLRTNFDMSPEEYRAKWGLPRDYPMVAPAYAEQRRGLAHQIGLGKGNRKAAVEAVTKPVRKAAKSVADGLAKAREHLGAAEPAAAPKRGRPRKVAS